MIKVNKDLEQVPASLDSALTKQRRNELIEKKGYIDAPKYNSRYKNEDVKTGLEQIYHKKCAYCEKDVGDSFYHIEHYRPKTVYYWLAYSWDNLLLCCDKCNVYKKIHFKIDGEKASYAPEDLTHIHNLGIRCRETEKPKLIHPEQEDVEDRLQFDKSGKICSDDERVKYTIRICQIDRPSANERRKTILDNLKRKFQSRMREYQIRKDQQSFCAVKEILFDFREETLDPRKEYLAFRRWIVRNWKTVLN